MAIPDFQSLMLPVLKASADGEVKTSDVVTTLGLSLKLSQQELSELLPSGKQTTFANRVNWAKSYLGKAGLVTLTRRGYFHISQKGKDILKSPPAALNTKYLEMLAGFKMYQPFGDTVKASPQNAPAVDDLTPDERIRSARDELEATLSAELLEKILAAPPSFFERLVVQLLVAMGYGGSAADAGRALGKTNDGGVDGVIDQDALGLDQIYVQAKRYTDLKVSPGEIRDFYGALATFKASKGLFVTTSAFTAAAREAAVKLPNKIVLIDSVQLTRLMIRFDIGCRVEEAIYIKKIDEEFFE